MMNDWEAQRLFGHSRELYDQVVRGEVTMEQALSKTRKDETLTVPLEDWEWAADYIVDFTLDRFGPAVLAAVVNTANGILGEQAVAIAMEPAKSKEPAKATRTRRPAAKKTSKGDSKYDIQGWTESTLKILEANGGWMVPGDVIAEVVGMRLKTEAPERQAWRVHVMRPLLESGRIERRGERAQMEYRISKERTGNEGTN